MADKIIFVDSDGTVMDSMTPKHLTSFGPAMIDILPNYKKWLDETNLSIIRLNFILLFLAMRLNHGRIFYLNTLKSF